MFLIVFTAICFERDLSVDLVSQIQARKISLASCLQHQSTEKFCFYITSQDESFDETDVIIIISFTLLRLEINFFTLT